MRAIRQLIKLNADLKNARISIIRDGEHHEENTEILRAKAPNHAVGFDASLELNGSASQILESLLVVANDEFEEYLKALSPALKSRLLAVSEKLSAGTEADTEKNMVEGV